VFLRLVYPQNYDCGACLNTILKLCLNAAVIGFPDLFGQGDLVKAAGALQRY